MSHDNLPTQLELHFKKGNYYFFIESWETAILFFEKALDIDPNHYRTLEECAMSYFRLAKIAMEEDEDYEKAQELANKSHELYLRAAENSPDYYRGDNCIRMANTVMEEIKKYHDL